jgi:hypothetical protein
MSARQYVEKFAQRAAIAAAGALVITSAVGAADLLGQAHADNPQCVTNPTVQCPPPAPESANVPNQPGQQSTNQPRTHVVCQPAGMFGQHCYRG